MDEEELAAELTPLTSELCKCFAALSGWIELDQGIHEFVNKCGRVAPRLVEPLVFKSQAPRIYERHLHSGFEDSLKSRIGLVILRPGFHRDQPDRG